MLFHAVICIGNLISDLVLLETICVYFRRVFLVKFCAVAPLQVEIDTRQFCIEQMLQLNLCP